MCKCVCVYIYIYIYIYIVGSLPPKVLAEILKWKVVWLISTLKSKIMRTVHEYIYIYIYTYMYIYIYINDADVNVEIEKIKYCLLSSTLK